MLKPHKESNKIYYNEQDIWETFPNKDSITKADFIIVIRTFFYLLMKGMIDNGDIYHLPLFLGKLSVVKSKTKGKMVDFQLLKKTGIKAFIKNLHSDGLMAFFHWDTTRRYYRLGPTKRCGIFKFKATRDWTRYLAKQIKETNSILKYYDY